MKKSTYQIHPSKVLNELYLKKDYQGANPMNAKILFVGRDANWAYDVETQEVFNYISEYLTDGVRFWNNYKIHHPFLLPNYKGDGKQYHKNFSKLNVGSCASTKISFVELIGFPTTGMAKSNKKMFFENLMSEANKNHLIKLDSLLKDSNKIIFIAWGLINDFKLLNGKTGLFKKFADLDKTNMKISDLNEYENIFIHRHFSDAISNSTLEKIAVKLKENL